MKNETTANELITLQVDGMTCSNCAAGIEKSLKNKGLHHVDVSFQNGEVIFEPVESLSLQNVKKEIENLGYKVRKEEIADEKKSRFSPLEIRFGISALLTLPLLAHMFSNNALLNDPIFQIAMSFPVMLIGWSFFGKSAYYSLKSGVPNMDVLISIGSTAAFFYSLWGTYLYFGTAQVHHFMFYETAATIITLVLLGNVIEHRSLKQTGSALRDLASLQPDNAKIIDHSSSKKVIREVKTSDVNVNDILLADTGERVVVDGIVESGEAFCNESIITGESIAVLKQKGDKLTGGTLIESGSVEYVATHVGKETVLSNIIALVKKTQGEKPLIQKLGDRVSAVFVPVVISIAIVTFLIAYFVFQIGGQQALMNAIAVLVISCPCAMGLATPTAVSAGLGRAAKRGILIKGGLAIESFADVKQIVFDKTGTLTTGKFQVKTFEIFDKTLEEKEVSEIMLALAERSAHPISISLKNHLLTTYQPADLYAIRELKGVGMTGKTQEDKIVALGSSRLLKENSNKDFNLYLSINEKIVVGIRIEDELKSDAQEMIQSFKNQGIETIMLSGDKKDRCEAIAKTLGIDKVFSEQLPEQKLEVIRKLSSEKNTAMVGDGVNDAPALSLAQTGISLSDATQVAINSAQIVLLNQNNLMSLFETWQLTKLTLRTIKQNLFWAFFYNVLAIPLAAFGYLSPMIAAFSMAFSDVIVIGNSIWLKSKRL